MSAKALSLRICSMITRVIGWISDLRPATLPRRSASRIGTSGTQSAWPDWIAATRAEGSFMIRIVIFLIVGFGPQYLSKASSTMRELRS
mgnify:CR=1 FL=1